MIDLDNMFIEFAPSLKGIVWDVAHQSTNSVVVWLGLQSRCSLTVRCLGWTNRIDPILKSDRIDLISVFYLSAQSETSVAGGRMEIIAVAKFRHEHEQSDLMSLGWQTSRTEDTLAAA